MALEPLGSYKVVLPKIFKVKQYIVQQHSSSFKLKNLHSWLHFKGYTKPNKYNDISSVDNLIFFGWYTHLTDLQISTTTVDCTIGGQQLGNSDAEFVRDIHADIAGLDGVFRDAGGTRGNAESFTRDEVGAPCVDSLVKTQIRSMHMNRSK